MNVLVTGGTGFIGSHLIERLAARGVDVTISVRKGRLTKDLSYKSVEMRECDLLAAEEVSGLMHGIETVYHLASIRGSGWPQDDETVRAVNVGFTRNLLEASLTHGVQHFVYVSSVSVYGHPRGGPVDEDHPCAPVTRYGRTKHESERLVEAFHREKGLAATIVRPVITYGPGDTWGMIPKLVRLIHAKRYVTVGSGENRVHLVFIDDLIDGLIQIMKRPGIGTGKYILAGDEPISINRLIKIVSSVLQRGVPRLHVPRLAAWIAGGLMEMTYRLCSIRREPFLTRDKIDIMCRDRYFHISRARTELGFTPQVGYEEGLRRTVAWCRTAGLL